MLATVVMAAETPDASGEISAVVMDIEMLAAIALAAEELAAVVIASGSLYAISLPVVIEVFVG